MTSAAPVALDGEVRRRVPYANGVVRREKVLDATLGLLALHGYDALSLRQIATAAGLTAPGLLRHYASKDDVLTALMEREVARTAAWISREGLDLTSPEDLLAIARHNGRRTSYSALFATLAGAAARPDHPAHAPLRDQYVGLPRTLEGVVRRCVPDELPPDELSRTAVRLVAGWDGLQVHGLYDPAIDVVTELTRHLESLRGTPTSSGADAGPALSREEYLVQTRLADSGYQVGRDRRTEIVDSAMRCFAETGFHATTLRDVSQAAGVPKSSLMHHFPTKDALLRAGLAHRDATTVVDREAEPADAASALFALADGARANESSPDLIAAYTVLVGEGAAAEHPAHEHLAARTARVRGYVKHLFLRARSEGLLPPGRDPDHEAVWLVALWDGLQNQWLYDRAGVPIADLLREHLEGVLGTSPPVPG